MKEVINTVMEEEARIEVSTEPNERSEEERHTGIEQESGSLIQLKVHWNLAGISGNVD